MVYSVATGSKVVIVGGATPATNAFGTGSRSYSAVNLCSTGYYDTTNAACAAAPKSKGNPPQLKCTKTDDC